ncbi:hypothetical protein AB2B41_05755 [Marimonas sp. MJW-29]|uniref:Uncharacterized protein n=1 Tax=Sulfitobacter sediminis TaxID=3234186 RepID=A0ABV3RK69_9RHOB
MTPLRTLVGKYLGTLGRAGKSVPADAPLPPLVPNQIKRRRPRTVMSAPPGNALEILCPDPTAEDAIRDKHQSRAQHLVRQERWDDLIRLIKDADSKRHMTPGTMSVAELLAYGARADVVNAAEHALIDGRPARGAPLLAGIEALEHVLAEYPKSYVVACIVAQAHMDIGWAWRGNAWDTEVPDRNRAAFEAHFERAQEILSAFCPLKSASPLLASACCALLGGIDVDERQAADRYEVLVDLNHANPRPMRAMGSHLLPRWYGSYKALELEARRTAAKVEETWGAGGYTWVQFDAIAYDDQACANLDLDFFIEGMRDILERRSDPYTVNLLAAYCANSMGQAFSGNDKADHVRGELAKCADWIVRKYLTELHPMIWAHAARGFDNTLRVHSPARFAASGRDDAIRLITSIFSKEIAAGKRIVFTDTGPVAMAH